MPDGPIVCNAGPLIALSLVGQLDLLRNLYRHVIVPEAVFREVLTGGTRKTGAAPCGCQALIPAVCPVCGRGRLRLVEELPAEPFTASGRSPP